MLFQLPVGLLNAPHHLFAVMSEPLLVTPTLVVEMSDLLVDIHLVVF